MIIIPISLAWLNEIFSKGYIFFRSLKAYNRLTTIEVYGRCRERVYILPSESISAEVVKDMNTTSQFNFSDITLSLCNIKRICFLFKSDYEKFKHNDMCTLLNISTEYLSHENAIRNLIHVTTFKNLETILRSNKLLTVGTAKHNKDIDKVLNRNFTYKKATKFDRDRRYIPSDYFFNEIDGVYFWVLFYKNSIRFTKPGHVEIYLNPSILDDYDWYMNFQDNFGIPELGTLFKKDVDLIVDHSEFTINDFELVITSEINNLLKYVDTIYVPYINKAEAEKSLSEFSNIIRFHNSSMENTYESI